MAVERSEAEKAEGSANTAANSESTSSSKRKLTKQERRALQEAQRAKKAEQKQQQSFSGSAQSTQDVKASATSQTKPQQQRKQSQRLQPRAFAMTERLGICNTSQAEADALMAAASPSDNVHSAIVAHAKKVLVGSLVCERASALALLEVIQHIVHAHQQRSEAQAAAATFVRELAQEIDSSQTFLMQYYPLGAACLNVFAAIRNRVTQLADTGSNNGGESSQSSVHDSLLNFVQQLKQCHFTLALESIIRCCRTEVIQHDDTIVTTGHSDTVQELLLALHEHGVHFDVIIVGEGDSYASRAMADALLSKGVDVTYTSTTGAAYAASCASRAIIGASAVLANCYVQASSGSSAICACCAHSGLPVHIVAEEIKFTDRAVRDAVATNNLDGAKHAANASEKSIGFMHDLVPPHFVSSVITDTGTHPLSQTAIGSVLANRTLGE